MQKLSLVQFLYGNQAPLASAYLMHGIKNQGIHNELIFTQTANIDLKYLTNIFHSMGDVLAIGCMKDMLPYVIAAVEKCKRLDRDKKIILGGTGPRNIAGGLLNAYDFLDYIVCGDGTNSLAPLARHIWDGERGLDNISGLVYRRDGKVCCNDFSPHPPLNDVLNYRKNIFGKFHEYYVWTSWGCPYSCTYCDSRPYIGKKLRYRDMEVVKKEIANIARCNSNSHFHIHVIDEAFFVNRTRVLEFCDMIVASKIPCAWDCYGRIDLIDKELLEILAASNCSGIYFGVESGSNYILEKIKKGFSIEDAIEKLVLARRYIRDINAAFIFRYPFERYRDFKATVDAMSYLNSKSIETQLFPLAPVKSSVMYKMYGNMLRFSTKAPNALVDLSRMSPECISLIQNNPSLFCDFYYYNPEELAQIMRKYRREFS